MNGSIALCRTRALRCFCLSIAMVGAAVLCGSAPAAMTGKDFSVMRLTSGGMSGDFKGVEQALAQGLDINTQDEYGDTALHKAARYARPRMVAFLIKKGAAVNVENKRGETPLHRAVSVYLFMGNPCYAARQAESARLLVAAGAPVDVYLAAGLGRLDLLKKSIGHDAALVRQCDKEKRTVLHWAVSSAPYQNPAAASEVVAYLVEQGADPNANDENGLTALHLALVGRHKELVPLLAAGTRIDVFCAAALGDLAKLQEFLRADKNAARRADQAGRTPLHWAALAGPANVAEVMTILVATGADVNARDKSVSWMPLDWAAMNGNMPAARWLMVHGAVAFRTKVPPGVNPIDQFQMEAEIKRFGFVRCLTPLHTAASGNQPKMIEMLLDAGCPVDVVDDGFRTPLCAAAYEGSMEAAALLIQRGADVNHHRAMTTPLMAACMGQHPKIVELLLKHGADTAGQRREGEGYTALEIARRKHNDEIIKLLEKYSKGK